MSQSEPRTHWHDPLSLELLSNPLFRRGGVLPTYKHDCDSLKWAFLYICCIADNSVVSSWLTVDIEECLTAKLVYLHPTGDWQPFKMSKKRKMLSRYGTAVYLLLVREEAAALAYKTAVLYETKATQVILSDLDLYTELKSSVRFRADSDGQSFGGTGGAS